MLAGDVRGDYHRRRAYLPHIGLILT